MRTVAARLLYRAPVGPAIPRASAMETEMSVASERARAAKAASAAVEHFYFSSRYGERRGDPGISDFTFGNPHEMPLAGPRARRSAAAPSRRTRTGSPTRPASRSRRPSSPRRWPANSGSPSSQPTSRSPPAPSARSRWPSSSFSMPAMRRSSPSRPGSATSRCFASPTRCRARCALTGAALRSRPRGDRGRDRTEDTARHRQYAPQSDRPHL